MLINGKWDGDWQPVQAKDDAGRFVRQTSSFRHRVMPDGETGAAGEGGFAAEPGRYHLYVALICPWASRTLMARTLKGLEDVVSVSVVDPRLGSQGWAFGTDVPGAMPDPLHDYRHVHELYTHADPTYTGRATVPVLWDRTTDAIVNNESADIVRILDSGFGELASSDVTLYPEALRPEIDALNERLYRTLNNGVYRAGFASSQLAYDEAVADVFAMLDELEARMTDGRAFLFGNEIVETDLRLFVTLVRFDVAYHGLFKCNLKRLRDYPALMRYVRRVHTLPGVLPGPVRAIVVVSAHWETSASTVTTHPSPPTMHDFAGWGPELDRIGYPARTDAALLAAPRNAFEAAGFELREDPHRGFDHGAWAPLRLGWLEARVPVVQLSLVRGWGPDRHRALGRALAPLAADGYLVVGSGATVHDLGSLAPERTPPPGWALGFDAWLAEALGSGDPERALRPETSAHYRRAHPTPEHLMPLFVALGAAGARGPIDCTGATRTAASA